tara:strand:+ start:516 stop:644 length:129 start_codon:yes stop_codon:yes gene_type:complete
MVVLSKTWDIPLVPKVRKSNKTIACFIAAVLIFAKIGKISVQ